MEGVELEQDGYGGTTDIPPVISCAVCGQASCEGCAPRTIIQPIRTGSILPWTEKPSLRAFFDTALAATTRTSVVFGRLSGRAPARALGFALLVELTALGSFVFAGTVLLLLSMPRLAIALLLSGSAWALCTALWITTAVLVLALHLLWAEFLERGMTKRGEPRDARLALEFACYSCGWDLLTSPLGVWLSARHARENGVPRTRALLAAFRAARPALRAYLEECRGQDDATAGSVIREASRNAVLVVLLAAILAIGMLLGIVVARW